MSTPVDPPAADQSARIPRPVFQFTIRQMMILVVLAATFCAGLLPAMHADAKSRPTWIVAEFVFLPLLLALVIWIIVRQGPFKGWLLGALTLGSVVGAIVATWKVHWNFVHWLWSDGCHRNPASFLLMLGLLFCYGVVLNGVRGAIDWLIPRRCPSCRGVWLIYARRRDPPESETPHTVRLCLRCEHLFVQDAGGPWTRAK